MLPALLSLVLLGADSESEKQVQAFLTRLDAQPLIYDGVVTSRVQRDAEGKIIRLQLDEARLIEDDWRAIETLDSLTSINLRRSNVKDADIAHLVKLPDLKGLIISSTDLTDDAIGSLGAITSLKSICMFEVLITREGVENLKKMQPKLQMGYVRRK